MYDRGVAGVKASAAKRIRRRLGIAEVSFHHLVAAHDDLADGFAVVRNLVVVVVDDPQLAGRRHLDACARLDIRKLAPREFAVAPSGSQIVMNGDVSVNP